MVRTQNLTIAGVFLATIALVGCSPTTYDGCSGPGGQDVQDVLNTMLGAVERQSSTELCSLFQATVTQKRQMTF